METSEQLYRGKISFVNYEKHFATIDFLQNNKQKSVNCRTDAADSSKKPQHYRLGDEVSFQLRLSDRGDKMAAFNVTYSHNEAISLLMQKAAIENRFSGFLKKIGDRYLVKDCESYIFFPLQLSPWEIPPPETAENEVILFSFLYIEKPNALQAELFTHNYIPAYTKAIWHFEKQMETQATVSKITPHGAYLNLFENAMQAKLNVTEAEKATLKVGDAITVIITHLTPNKIVVKKV